MQPKPHLITMTTKKAKPQKAKKLCRVKKVKKEQLI
jgi:hypothetical protein